MAQTFGELIRDGRTARGIVQYDLAAEIGVRQASISVWENDRGIPDPANVERLIRVLALDSEKMWLAFGRAVNESMEQL